MAFVVLTPRATESVARDPAMANHLRESIIKVSGTSVFCTLFFLERALRLIPNFIARGISKG